MTRSILISIIASQLLFILNLKAGTATHLQVDYVASGDSFPSKIPFYVRLSARDIDNNIDDTYGNTNSAIVSVISGPGTFSGPFSVFFLGGIAEFTDLSFNTSGNYVIKFSSGSLSADTISIKMFDYFSFSNSSSVLKFINKHSQDTIATDDFLFRYVIAANSSNKIDTTCNASVSLSIIGSGSLTGVTNKNFTKGVALFSSLSLTATGANQIVCSSGSLIKDTSTVFVGTSTTSTDTTSSTCDTTTVGSRSNLGLYSGTCIDLTFSPNGRLFAGVRAPASLFYSDDTAKTWEAAFPVDSLEFNCGNSGWGGGGHKVLTNNKGWVSAYTEQELGSLKSTEVSFHNGDSGSWQTASDQNMMMDLGYGMQTPRGIGLTDYYMYSVLTNTIVIRDSSGIKNIIDASLYLGSFPLTNSIARIAPANNSSSYPFYIIVDTTGDMGDNISGKLYYFDGSLFTSISLPSGLSGISEVFTSPLGNTGDTVFISGRIINSNLTFTQKTYRSYDKGINWQDISWALDPYSSSISDLDYSSSSLGNMILILQGKAISKDLGDTWEIIFNSQYSAASVSIYDQNIVLASKNKGVEISTSGLSGTFSIADNYGLEAIQINKIARTSNKSVFYLATRSGLAYTTAYLDTLVSAFDKWHAPYGEFPIASVNDSDGIFAVVIDPYDSLHVIAGGANNFNVSFTGYNGFQYVNVTGFGLYMYVRDILFVDSDIALAVTGRISEGDNNSDWGNIWRTVDGGLNWTNVSPAGFYSGNVLAMGISATDTVLYAGSGFAKSLASSDRAGILWKSTDLGLTWMGIHAGPTSITDITIDSMPIFDIAVDPRGTDTLYIASGHNTDNAFVVSYDGGITYHYTDLLGEGAFSTVSVDLENPDTNVYVGNRKQIFDYNPSTDSGQVIFTGLPGEIMYELAHGSILVGSTTGFYGVDGDKTIDIVGIDKVSVVTNRVLLYPNPSSYSFTIEVNSSQQKNDMQINLLDVLGRNIKTIYKGKTEQETMQLNVDCNNLVSGTYFIRVIGDNEIINKKILISK